MKKNVEEKKTKEKIKRGFVWWWLRISLGLIIIYFFLSLFITPYLILLETAWQFYTTVRIENLIAYILMFSNFLFSIISLVKYKKKTFAIFCLVLSLFLILASIVGTLLIPAG